MLGGNVFRPEPLEVTLQFRARQGRDFAPSLPIDGVVGAEQDIEPSGVAVERHVRAGVAYEQVEQLALIKEQLFGRQVLRLAQIREVAANNLFQCLPRDNSGM